MDLKKEYERIRKYVSKVDVGNYDLSSKDANTIYNCSTDPYRMIYLAYKYGFEKGCRKTKKAVKV